MPDDLYITPGSPSDVVATANAGTGNPAQNGYQAEYNALGIKINATIPLTEQASGNSVGVTDPVGSGTATLAPPSIASNGQLNTNSIVVGASWITIDAGESIQDAITALNTAGGGTLYLQAGTYIIPGDIVGYSSITIQGVSPTATILYFGGNSYNLSFAGTNAYTTGTITSISSGVNVVGSGTSWTAAMAGRSLFLGTRSYVIASVTDSTHLTLAEGYGDNVSLPGASYRIVTQVVDVGIKNIGFLGSGITSLAFSDCRRITLDNVQFIENDIGYSILNSSEVFKERVVIAASTSDGVQCTNVGLCDWISVNSNGNGGNGFTLNNVKDLGMIPGTANGNGGDGFNLTTVVNSTFLVEASSNGGQGVEFVTGCDNDDLVSATIEANTSDGVKYTASDTNCHIYGADVVANGGYGINIVDSTSSNIVITTNNFASNTSGAINDSGTGTLIRGNTGINDNSTSGTSIVSAPMIAAETITAGNAVAAGYYQSDGGLKLDTVTSFNGSGTSASVSFTVGNNSNRILVAFIAGSNPLSSVAFNGSSLTQVDAPNDSAVAYAYSGYLIAPTTGAHNFTFSQGTATGWCCTVYSYYNAAQSSQPQGHTASATLNTSGSISNTPTANGTITVAALTGGHTGGFTLGTLAGAPNNASSTTGSGGGANVAISCGDNGQDPGEDAQTFSFSGGVSGDNFLLAVSIAPVTAPSFGYCVQASAAASNLYAIPAATTFRSTAFVGFATTSQTAGASVIAAAGGLYTGLSGLTPLKDYYLANTAGTIATTAGTNSRKVGIATTSTQLIVTNIW